jgi:hypothetical protein
MLAAAALVIVLTAVTDTLGPQLSGLLAPFPVATAIVAAFTHKQRGVDAVVVFFRGFLPALVSFGLFCVALAVALEPLGLALALMLALAAQLSTQVITLWRMRRRLLRGEIPPSIQRNSDKSAAGPRRQRGTRVACQLTISSLSDEGRACRRTVVVVPKAWCFASARCGQSTAGVEEVLDSETSDEARRGMHTHVIVSYNSLESAKVVVPLLLEYVTAASVLDCGCKHGEWLSIFQQHGTKERAGIRSREVRALPHHQPLGFQGCRS